MEETKINLKAFRMASSHPAPEGAGFLARPRDKNTSSEERWAYRCTVAYDGTAYFGWQKTRSGPSIQEWIEKAVSAVSGESATPEAASRTDRGVHAQGQVVLIILQKQWVPQLLLRALNAKLPPDIRIRSIERAAPDFHPTLDAVEKEYHYHLCCTDTPNPTRRLYSWAVRTPLSFSNMEKAIPSMIGTFDFSSFANESEKNPLCTLRSIEFLFFSEQRAVIVMKGDRFLYKMARTLAGTLVDIGAGKIPPEHLSAILAARDRKKAGVTAPSRGLFLYKVIYNPLL